MINVCTSTRSVCLAALYMGCIFALGCESKPAVNVKADTPSVNTDGALTVAPVVVADEKPAEAAISAEKPEKSAAASDSRDANDDGLPDDAHVFDIPEGDNDVLLQFVAEAPGRMLSSADEEKGGLAITTAAEKVLKNNPTPEQRLVAAEAMFYWLQRLQSVYSREAAEVQLYWKLRLGDYEKIEDEKLAELVARYRLINQALSWNQLRIDQREEFAGQLTSYFVDRPLDEADLETAQQVAQAILNSGDRPATVETYRSLAQILKSSSQPDIVSEAAKLDGMGHRLESVGQEITIEATKLDGEPLDWAAYRGKVVLIDYWATWCGPCVAELPNIRKLYDIYHQRGFDVIGVSVDTDQAELKSFVEKNQIPWTITFHDDAEAAGLSQPLALQFGISTVPVALLVDQEGRLISLEARGADLASWLEKLLGPADISSALTNETPASDSPKTEAPADEKPSDEKPNTDTPAGDKPAEAEPKEENPAAEKPVDESPTEVQPADKQPGE